MLINIKVTGPCERCEEEIWLDGIVGYCGECSEKIGNETLKSALLDVSDKKFLWENNNKDDYPELKNDEKEMFLKGLKKGVYDALFFIAAFYDEEEWFDNEIHNLFKSNNHVE